MTQLQNCKFLDKRAIHRKNIQFKKKNNLNNKIVSSNSIYFNHNNLFNFKRRKKNHRNIQNYIIKFSFLNKKLSFHHILSLFPINIFNTANRLPTSITFLRTNNTHLIFPWIEKSSSPENLSIIRNTPTKYIILLDDHNRVLFKVTLCLTYNSILYQYNSISNIYNNNTSLKIRFNTVKNLDQHQPINSPQTLSISL